MARDAHAPRSSALPRPSERLLPWLVASIVVGGLCALVVLVGEPTPPQEAVLLLVMVGLVVVTGMVAARSSSAIVAVDHEERQRPALEELFAADDAFASPSAPAPSFVEGMERWASGMLELTEHALAVPDAPAEVVAELAAADAATRDLRELLRSTTQTPVGINGMATLHGVCASWEADQRRVEQLGALVDPSWHQRWMARTVVERRLRHGARPAAAVVLPYRS
jgi:Zn-dependent alcohol dehydrogenase